MIELLKRESLKIEKLKAKLRQNGMDDCDIEKFVGDGALKNYDSSPSPNKMEFSHLNYNQEYATR